MTVRIWLNRTFATNVHVVHMLHENPDGVPVHVIASHVDPDSPVLAAADQTHPEPVDLDGDAYAHHALDFCVTHGVDVFWPTWNQTAIATHRGRFTAAGVRVMTSGAEAVKVFDDKARTYEHAAALGVPVPDHRTVTGVSEFTVAYDWLRGRGHERVCFKPVAGVGGEGFRIVAEGPRTWSALTGPVSAEVPLSEVVAALSAQEGFAPLMVMPFLAGGEVSVDVLAHEGRVLSAVPRFKRSRTRGVELLDAPALVAETAKIVSRFGLSYLGNVQFRFDEAGQPFLLEVNGRASGGLFQSCLAGGNLPWAAVQVALKGAAARVPVPRFPVRLSTVGMAVELPTTRT